MLCLKTFHYICYTLRKYACIILILVLGCFAFWSCQKDAKTTACVPFIAPIGSFAKQFQFKQGSYWVYQSSTNPNIDTIKVTQISQRNIGYPNNPSPGNAGISPNYCDSFQFYLLVTSHSYLSWAGGRSFAYSLTDNNIFLGQPYGVPYATSYALVNKNISDSIYTGGIEGVNYIKLENRFDTLTILGTKYNNVYQMCYSSAWNSFKRIWWCPNVGFVQFQFINQTTSNTQIGNSDTWQLKNYHVLF